MLNGALVAQWCSCCSTVLSFAAPSWRIQKKTDTTASPHLPVYTARTFSDRHLAIHTHTSINSDSTYIQTREHARAKTKKKRGRGGGQPERGLLRGSSYVAIKCPTVLSFFNGLSMFNGNILVQRFFLPCHQGVHKGTYIHRSKRGLVVR